MGRQAALTCHYETVPPPARALHGDGDSGIPSLAVRVVVPPCHNTQLTKSPWSWQPWPEPLAVGG